MIFCSTLELNSGIISPGSGFILLQKLGTVGRNVFVVGGLKTGGEYDFQHCLETKPKVWPRF
jgi:hypothetical protein